MLAASDNQPSTAAELVEERASIGQLQDSEEGTDFPLDTAMSIVQLSPQRDGQVRIFFSFLRPLAWRTSLCLNPVTVLLICRRSLWLASLLAFAYSTHPHASSFRSPPLVL